MKAFFHSILTAALLFAVPAAVADELPDSVRQRPVYPIEEVVVTGTRNETDVRLLPMTVSVVDRAAIERSGRQSLLPILTEQVPGLFATARGIMGYGVSTGAAVFAVHLSRLLFFRSLCPYWFSSLPNR